MMAAPEGALVGLSLGAAVLSIAWWMSDRRPLRMVDRIAPFAGIPRRASTFRPDPTLGLTAMLSLAGLDVVRRPTDPRLETRLDQAGRPGLARYRVERLVWASAGAVAGLVLATGVSVSGTTVAAAGVLAGTGGLAGWLASDLLLRIRARRRQRELEQQLPNLADLVALAVTAGVPPPAALEQAAGTLGGPLSGEVRRMVGDVHAGQGFDAAMRALAERVGLPSLHLFVEGILVAVDRGTPMADVARAQATDLRTEERRRLMESAGRKDVSMLVPIVFLVLPTVVLVALFPGLQSLQLVVP